MLQIFPGLFSLLCFMKIWFFSLGNLNIAALLFDSFFYCSGLCWWELSPILKRQLILYGDCRFYWLWVFVVAHLFPVHNSTFLCLILCMNSTQHIINESSKLLSTFPTSSGEAEVLYPVHTYLLCSAEYFNMSFLLYWMYFRINRNKHSFGRLAMLHLLINLRLFINIWKMFSCKNGSAEHMPAINFTLPKYVELALN